MYWLQEDWQYATDQWTFQLLNALIIILSLFQKVPQINIMRKKRHDEIMFLNIQPMLMEIVGYSIMTLYNYKNSYSIWTYVEYVALLVQVYFMIFLVQKARRKLWRKETIYTVVTYFSVIFSFLLGLLPKVILTYGVPICTPSGSIAKCTYMMGIYKNGNSEAVSLLTWVFSVTTNAGRLLTIYMSSKDNNLMINYGISAILSTGVLLTAVYYKLNPQIRVIATKRSEPSVRRYHNLD